MMGGVGGAEKRYTMKDPRVLLILCVVEVLERSLEEEAEVVPLLECLLPPLKLLLLLTPDLVIYVAARKENQSGRMGGLTMSSIPKRRNK
eukprot:9620523-Ditylum_brightwellii.AAC.1